jgi:hypothetical protein
MTKMEIPFFGLHLSIAIWHWIWLLMPIDQWKTDLATM